MPAHEAMSKIESWRTKIRDLNSFSEAELRFEQAEDIRPDAIVAQQDVPDPADESGFHRTFATKIFFPEGSNA